MLIAPHSRIIPSISSSLPSSFHHHSFICFSPGELSYPVGPMVRDGWHLRSSSHGVWHGVEATMCQEGCHSMVSLWVLHLVKLYYYSISYTVCIPRLCLASLPFLPSFLQGDRRTGSSVVAGGWQAQSVSAVSYRIQVQSDQDTQDREGTHGKPKSC